MDERSQRRLKANEMVFRKANSDVADFIEDQTGRRDKVIEFYCECSRARCRQRIQLSLEEYRQAHENDRSFIILPGHQEPEVEKVIHRSGSFFVVEKQGPMPSSQAVDLALSNTPI